MDTERTTMPPGEGLAHQAAATNSAAGASLSCPVYHNGNDRANALAPEQVGTLHRIYQFILSW